MVTLKVLATMSQGEEGSPVVTKLLIPRDINEKLHRKLRESIASGQQKQVNGPITLEVQPDQVVSAETAAALNRKLADLPHIIVGVRDEVVWVISLGSKSPVPTPDVGDAPKSKPPVPTKADTPRRLTEREHRVARGLPPDRADNTQDAATEAIKRMTGRR